VNTPKAEATAVEPCADCGKPTPNELCVQNGLGDERGPICETCAEAYEMEDDPEGDIQAVEVQRDSAGDARPNCMVNLNGQRMHLLDAFDALVDEMADEGTQQELHKLREPIRKFVDWKPKASAGDAQTPSADVRELDRTAPARIYLQISDESDDRDEPFPHNGEVSWCADSCVSTEVEYIRFDLVSKYLTP
jgi:hypothetical protein